MPALEFEMISPVLLTPLVTAEFSISIPAPPTEIVPAFEIVPTMVLRLRTAMPVGVVRPPGAIVPLLTRLPVNDVLRTTIPLVVTPVGLVYGNGPFVNSQCTLPLGNLGPTD
jgi:hypothetical protein